MMKIQWSGIKSINSQDFDMNYIMSILMAHSFDMIHERFSCIIILVLYAFESQKKDLLTDFEKKHETLMREFHSYLQIFEDDALSTIETCAFIKTGWRDDNFDSLTLPRNYFVEADKGCVYYNYGAQYQQRDSIARRLAVSPLLTILASIKKREMLISANIQRGMDFPFGEKEIDLFILKYKQKEFIEILKHDLKVKHAIPNQHSPSCYISPAQPCQCVSNDQSVLVAPNGSKQEENREIPPITALESLVQNIPTSTEATAAAAAATATTTTKSPR